MRILVATHHLDDYAGSEVYTLCLVRGLLERGHHVAVYTRYPGGVSAEIEASGVVVATTLESLRGSAFEVAHVHHSLTAIDVRAFFPRLPMLFLSHGVLPFLEAPPGIDVGIGQYAAVSEGGAEHLRGLGVRAPVEVHRNLVDARQFSPGPPVTAPPRCAVVLSSQMTAEKLRVIEEACAVTGLDVRVVGAPGPRVNQAEALAALRRADIVIGQGRGIVEAMLCERPAIVFNPPASDGLVTPATFFTSMAENFSGRALRRGLSAASLAEEIRTYEAGHEAELRRLTVEHFGLDGGVERLVRTYERLAVTEVPGYDAAAVRWAHSALGVAGEYAAEAYRRHADHQLRSQRNESEQALAAAETRLVELARLSAARADELVSARREVANLASRVAAADRRWLPGRAHQLRAWVLERRRR